ncbi:hypothetical protein KCP73_15475 [Salmonella enterica subsp. enterica]|nr:hypothetical protein KCP73_15475 [Salmonella enterica subsp. enterica]
MEDVSPTVNLGRYRRLWSKRRAGVKPPPLYGRRWSCRDAGNIITMMKISVCCRCCIARARRGGRLFAAGSLYFPPSQRIG